VAQPSAPSFFPPPPLLPFIVRLRPFGEDVLSDSSGSADWRRLHCLSIECYSANGAFFLRGPSTVPPGARDRRS